MSHRHGYPVSAISTAFAQVAFATRLAEQAWIDLQRAASRRSCWRSCRGSVAEVFVAFSLIWRHCPFYFVEFFDQQVEPHAGRWSRLTIDMIKRNASSRSSDDYFLSGSFPTTRRSMAGRGLTFFPCCVEYMCQIKMTWATCTSWTLIFWVKEDQL